MALWRLSPRTDTLWWCVEGRDPWQPPYDRAFGFVVRAADEEAVHLFLSGRISFGNIHALVQLLIQGAERNSDRC
jgi:hypothetical protein